MALPSAVTLGSAALIVAAGVGLAAWPATEEQPDDQVTTGERASIGMPDQAALEPTGAGPDARTRISGDPAAEKTSSQKSDNQQPDLVPKVLVEVFNNSGVSGLAADKAAALKGAGWHVASTDNWHGSIPESTVYYPDRLRFEAQQLAKALHVNRLLPTVSPMSFDRLTVIFTSA